MRKRKVWSTKWMSAYDGAWRRSGGQGKLFLVHPAGAPDGQPSVLKELNNQVDPDRRRRMRREVVTLETLPQPGTPRVLDHNTECYADLDVDLYAVFEFVPGPTLEEHISANETLPLQEAIALITSLITTLELYHKSGIGHRDIKPDNIVLRDYDPGSPTLIDFGLTFNLQEPSSTDTADWQQVGNRFLALPEHAAFSVNKRDLRSDLTFCVAILFFTLTGAHPATLTDDQSRLPHQRPRPRAMLDALPEQQRLVLLTIFDIGFSVNLGHRWQSIEALRAHIGRIKPQMAEEDRTEVRIADIRARAAAKISNLAIEQALDRVRSRIKSSSISAVALLGDGFRPEIEERLTTMNDMSTWIRCGVRHAYDGGLTNTFYRVDAVGDELVVSETLDPWVVGAGAVTARIPLGAPEALSVLEGLVEQHIIGNVHRNVSIG